MKKIIFDFDGTIADSSMVFMQGWNQFAKQYGYLPVNEDDIKLARNMTIHECARKFRFPMYKIPVILPKIYSYFKQHITEVQVYDGMKDVLKQLKKAGFKLYILSSNDKANIETFLQHNGIDEIDEVLTSNKIFGKDYVLKKFMKMYGYQPNEVFYIGDELRDIQACNKCGIPFGWASWGLQGLELIKKEKPMHLFYKANDIVRILVEE